MGIKKHIPCIFILTILAILGVSCDRCVDGSTIYIKESIVYKKQFYKIENNGEFIVSVFDADSSYIEVIADENVMPFINISNTDYTLILDKNADKCYNASGNIYINVYTNEKLNEFTQNGSGIIQIINKKYTYNADNMAFVVNGSGKILIDSLICKASFLQLNSDGLFAAQYLKTDSFTFQHTGSGNIKIYNLFALSGSIDNTGNGSDSLFDGTINQAIYTNSGNGNLVSILPVNTIMSSLSGNGHIFVNFKHELKVTLSGSGNVYYKGEKDKIIINSQTGNGKIIEWVN